MHLVITSCDFFSSLIGRKDVEADLMVGLVVCYLHIPPHSNPCAASDIILTSLSNNSRHSASRKKNITFSCLLMGASQTKLIMVLDTYHNCVKRFFGLQDQKWRRGWGPSIMEENLRPALP